MSLRIKSLHLKDFKSYSNINILINSNFNVFIGDNNIGKTTIFEALLLWKECYDISIKSNGKQFYNQQMVLYLNFEDLHFMRLSQDTDIFNGQKRTCEITLTLTDTASNTDYNLGFKLRKPANIENAYVRLNKLNEAGFRQLEQYCETNSKKLKSIINFYQTKPISNVLSKEPYMFAGQVRKKISKGKSNEVLRNKIISMSDHSDLENRMKEVLGENFQFVLPKRIDRQSKEYIDLKVSKNSEKLDIYLQGSGFLQVAEIFSTIVTFNDALNVLLIDEPDSHINARIQGKLLTELKKINGTQIFIISHNDNFVSDLTPSDVIFINESNKSSGEVQSLTDVNFDEIHYAMGGIITSLTQLQKSSKIVFFEGRDDITYINSLVSKLEPLSFEDGTFSSSLSKYHDVTKWHLRGKDYLEMKLRHNKQFCCQLVVGKQYYAVYDKDFATVAANNSFMSKLQGANFGNHSHNGYCVESILFSELAILHSFLHQATGLNLSEIASTSNQFLDQLRTQITNTTSSKYSEMKEKFNSQKKVSRPELENVEFDSFAPECNVNIQYGMNKTNIREYVQHIESHFNIELFPKADDADDTYASGLFSLYLQNINQPDIVYPDLINLINFIID